MFICIKKRHIFFVIFLATITFCSVFFATFASKTEYVYTVPDSKYVVVIDAGHGGIDGGCVGKTTGVYESDLNLVFARTLAKQLNNMGVSVVMTRQDKNGLYDSSAKNLKKSEMSKRKQIIDEANPDLVVSIHMNSYSLSSCRGAQVFYKNGSETGKMLAQDIQSELSSQIDYAKSTAKVGDYYIVNCTNLPSVLVECGFLSNREEELLLQNTSYQEKMCYAISCGIMKFLNEK